MLIHGSYKKCKKKEKASRWPLLQTTLRPAALLRIDLFGELPFGKLSFNKLTFDEFTEIHALLLFAPREKSSLSEKVYSVNDAKMRIFSMHRA